MGTIDITGFLGEMPKLAERHLPPSAAQSAQDVRLDDGILTPIRAKKNIATGDKTAQTIYLHEGSWLTWTSAIDLAPGPVATDRLYYTGDGVPRMRVGATIYNLKLPRPTTALTAVVSGTGTGPTITRLYVYTYVTGYGEESEPNNSSLEVSLQEGQTVTLSGFATAASGRNVTDQRIYRTQTGSVGTYLYLIDERADSAGNYVDTKVNTDFSEPIPSVDWTPPPDTLSGLTAMPNGMMAAFDGKQLYFCEPYRPHAWPEKYVQTTDYDIVGLGSVGNTLVILTTGRSAVATGSLPEAIQMTQLEVNYPCINARSIVDMGYAVVYASNDVLVSVDTSGQHVPVSTALFNRDEWQELSPATFVSSQHEGKYVAFYSYTSRDGTQTFEGMLRFDFTANWISRSAITAAAAFFNIEDGSLNYQDDKTDDINRYDDPDGARTSMYWKSKEFINPYPVNYGAIKIDGAVGLSSDDISRREEEIAAIQADRATIIAAPGDLGAALNEAEINAYTFGGDLLPIVPSITAGQGVSYGTIRVYADKVLVKTINDFNVPLRLPSGFQARTWEVDVSGNIAVEKITIASTMSELSQHG